MKTYLIALTLLLGSNFIQAQNFVIPQAPQLEVAEDYEKYHEDILKGIEWVLKTPLNKEVEKRNQFGEFFIKWIEGSAAVTIELHAGVLPFIESKPEMLIYFMYGWTQKSLKQEGKLSIEEGSYAGLEAVANYYEQHKSLIGNDKSLNKIVKLNKKDQLMEYIKKELKS
tara:strand:- start:246 stop:752 length:507 start_codon:yes stop_codon:yes gene_type:complete